MSTTLQIPTSDARQFDALYSAAVDSSAPAIVLVQEIFGINHAMKEAVREWSAEQRSLAFMAQHVS